MRMIHVYKTLNDHKFYNDVSFSVPCHVPSTEYGIYTMSPSASPASIVSGLGQGDEKELNETDPVPNGQVVHFSCEYG